MLQNSDHRVQIHLSVLFTQNCRYKFSAPLKKPTVNVVFLLISARGTECFG
jgi:hypothetical protein